MSQARTGWRFVPGLLLFLIPSFTIAAESFPLSRALLNTDAPGYIQMEEDVKPPALRQALLTFDGKAIRIVIAGKPTMVLDYANFTFAMVRVKGVSTPVELATWAAPDSEYEITILLRPDDALENDRVKVFGGKLAALPRANLVVKDLTTNKTVTTGAFSTPEQGDVMDQFVAMAVQARVKHLSFRAADHAACAQMLKENTIPPRR